MARKHKIRTIDIQAKEWFDRINGNSYFSARITINYGTDNSETYVLPFQYGYGDHYEYQALKHLVHVGRIKDVETHESLWRYCDRNGIVKRATKQENCLKRDVVAYGQK